MHLRTSNHEVVHSVKYSIRESKRTKKLHLKINRLAQVEVVMPFGTSQTLVEQFVKTNLTWIKSQIDKILSKNKDNKLLSNTLPDTICFPCINRTYQVAYQPNSGKQRLLDDVLTVTAKNESDKREQLRDFIHATAKRELTPLLKTLSSTHNLPFNKIFIRAQKTRWGSCSSKQNINLNRNILFLSAAQAEYLIIHELCHTVHLNHSSNFWNLVGQHYPEFKVIDKSLRNATQNIPLWAITN